MRTTKKDGEAVRKSEEQPNHEVDLENYWYNGDIKALRDQLDELLSLGYTKCDVEVGWGYYDDVDTVYIIPKREKG